MSMPNFQLRVNQFVSENNLETNIESRLLDLLSEIGELAKEVLKGNQYGKTDFFPTPDWDEELADAFFSLICLANSTGVNIEEALSKVLIKYKSRINEKGEAGSGQ